VSGEPPAAPASDEPPTPPTAATGQADLGLLRLKDKVQRYLTDLVGSVELTPEGVFTFRAESTRLFVSCRPWEQTENTLVQLIAPVLQGCEPTPELYKHIATHADDYLFGHLSAREDGDKLDILFTHTLLGDFLDPDELKRAVAGMIRTANDLDDALKTRFGGSRFHEDQT
jgi:hypothetical protein